MIVPVCCLAVLELPPFQGKSNAASNKFTATFNQGSESHPAVKMHIAGCCSVPVRCSCVKRLCLSCFLPLFQADRALQCFLECIAQIREKRTEIILRRKLPRL